MKIVNERSGIVLALKFLDENGKAITPDSGQYQVSDLMSGTVLTSWTIFNPTSYSHSLQIAQENNRILESINDTETRVVTVVVNKAGVPCTEQFLYSVKNLHDIPCGLTVDPEGGAVSGGAAVIT